MSQILLFDDNLEDGFTLWEPTREAALNRLNTFVPSAGRAYASQRNYDFGPNKRGNVSCLSPWVRHRLILEEEILVETLKRHSLSGAEKFIQEVFWRSYFKGWLEQRPTVWMDYKSDLFDLLERGARCSDFRSRYEEAINGNTGVDCFDQWVQELIVTGYLHNHSRMWFASIWIFTLRLPWQLGADFFYRYLLDGDPASNTLSWRWVAGLHTKGKHYLARRSNIEKYTNGRFSPNGLVIDVAPLYEDVEHERQSLAISSGLNFNDDYGLLITEEDLHPESLKLPSKPKGILGLCAIEGRSPLLVGEKSKQFTKGAIENALTRAEHHFQCDAVYLSFDDWSATLIDWAHSLGLRTLVTAHAPVGPVADKIEKARPILKQAGISIQFVKRDYDNATWPHTSAGFFKLKKKIPSLLEGLKLQP